MEPTLTPEQRQAFAQALYAGNKIEAIKQLRDVSGLGLKEAKEVLDRLEAELRAAHPERFAAPNKKGTGCILLLILLFPFGVLVWLVLKG